MGNKSSAYEYETQSEYETLKTQLYRDISNGTYTCIYNENAPIYKFNLDILNEDLGSVLLDELIKGDCDEKELNLLLEQGASVNITDLSGKYIIEYLFEYKFYNLVSKCVEHGSNIPRKILIKCITSNVRTIGEKITYNKMLLNVFNQYKCLPLTTEELVKMYNVFQSIVNRLGKSSYTYNNKNIKVIALEGFQKRLKMYYKIFSRMDPT